MLRRNAQRRAGITLIEMLVVIAIIAVLMSLVLSAAMKAMVVSDRAETTARIAAINNGIGTFKSMESFGKVTYIPAGRLESNGTWQPFRLRNTYPANPSPATEPGLYSFEAQYIIRVFGVKPEYNPATGQTEIVNLGYSGLSADLDANQTLTFFLTGIPQVSGADAVFTGFSNDSQRPFTPRSAASDIRKGPVLDLGGKRKYVLSTTSPAGLSFASMIDGFGNKMAYFSCYDGQPNKNYGGYGNGFFVNNSNGQSMGAVIAYSRNGQFENPSGFQLLSAGKNERFGTTGDWTNVTSDGDDDQANFSSALLGAGPK